MTATTGAVRSADGTSISYQSLGTGVGLIIVGGALATSHHYLALAQALAGSFEVHLIERRGRGASGPQGTGYSIGKEVEDLFAVQSATGATMAFGHSYGGLVVLEAARRSSIFTDVALYEPGVSIGGSIATHWVTDCRARLAANDARCAFAVMVRGSGFAPRAITQMPLWTAELILRAAVRGERWEQIRTLMPSQLAEHEQVSRVDDGSVQRFASVGARVLLLGGGASPPFITSEPFAALQQTIPRSAVEMIGGLDHEAPTETAPEILAEVLARRLGSGGT